MPLSMSLCLSGVAGDVLTQVVGAFEEHSLVPRVAWRAGEEAEGSVLAPVFQALPHVGGVYRVHVVAVTSVAFLDSCS